MNILCITQNVFTEKYVKNTGKVSLPIMAMVILFIIKDNTQWPLQFKTILDLRLAIHVSQS